MKKTLLTILCTVLVCSCVMGVTLAYLMDSTDSIENTFTVGKVDINLTEAGAVNNKQEFKMIPGATITKDADVTVISGSEACYLFVKIEENGNASGYITYDMADGWIALADEDGVYYRAVEAATQGDRSFGVFESDTVTVGTNVKKDTANVTITITAYAVQQQSLTVAQAWEQAVAASTNP